MPASDLPVLYDYWRSSAAYRVRIALNLKGIAYRSVKVDLLGGEHEGDAYRARNPQGLVPTLEIDGLTLTQSLAIIDYLDAKVPDPRLVPKDAAARSPVLAMALLVACEIHPVNNGKQLRRLIALGVDDEQRNGWYRDVVREGLTALEELARRHARDYLSGDAPGIADLTLVPQLYNARRYKVPIDDFPTLLAMDAKLAGVDAFARAHPDRVREATAA